MKSSAHSFAVERSDKDDLGYQRAAIKQVFYYQAYSFCFIHSPEPPDNDIYTIWNDLVKTAGSPA